LIEKVVPPDPVVYADWQKKVEENKKNRNDYVQLTLQRSQNIQRYVTMNVGQITTELFAGSGSAKDFGKAFDSMDPGLKSLFTDTLGVPVDTMQKGSEVASIYRSLKDIKTPADFDALDPEFKEALAKKTGVSVSTMRSMVNVSSKVEESLKSKKAEIAAAGGVGGLMSWAEEAKKKAEAAAYELTKQLLQEEVLDKFAPGQNINDLAQWPPVVNWREIHRVDPRVKAVIAETVGFGTGSAAVAELEAMIGQAQRYAELVEQGMELKDRLTEHTGKLEDAIKNNDVEFVKSYASDLGVAASTVETLINTSYALGSASYAWDFSADWIEDPIWGVDIPDGEWYSRYPERMAVEGGVVDAPDLNDQTPDPPGTGGRGPYLDKYVLLEAFGLNIASVSENQDGTINYAGDVRIDLDRAQADIGYGSPIFDRLPPEIRFGEITGNFGVIGENLNSLEGFPYLVTGRISIGSSNQLKTLETLPEIKACGGFFANGLKELKTLKGSPRIVNGTFDVSDTGIISLEGGPNTVNGNYVCSECPNLSSIFGAPTTLKGQFISQDNDAITVAMVENYKKTNNLKWLSGQLLGKSVTEQERVRFVQATAVENAANASVDGSSLSGDARPIDTAVNTSVVTGQTFATTGPGWLQPGNIQVSLNGLKFLERKEGIRYQVYDDKNGKIISSYGAAVGTPTIGIGHAIFAGARGRFEMYLGGRQKMTSEQVYALKKEDIPRYAKPMNVKATSPMTQNMFDAMLSLSFNAGAGGKALAKAIEFINQKRYIDAANAIKNGPQTGKGIGFIPSLVKRRKEEAEMFLSGMPGAPPNALNTTTGVKPVGSPSSPQKINTIQVGGSAPLNTPSPFSPMGSRVVQNGSLGQFKSSMNNKNAPFIFVVGGLDVRGRKCGEYMWDYFTDAATGKYHVYVKSTHDSGNATSALSEAWSIMKQHGLQSYKSVCYYFSAGNKASLPVLKQVSPTKWHAIFLVGPCLVGSESYVNGMVPLIQSAPGRFNFSSVGGTKEGGDANYNGKDALQLKLQLMQPIPAGNQLVGSSHIAQNSAVVSRLNSIVGT
jgi:lysozyme